MTRMCLFLVVSIVALSVLVSAGPTVVAIVRAAVPLVLAVGGVIVVVRIVWHYTKRY